MRILYRIFTLYNIQPDLYCAPSSGRSSLPHDQQPIGYYIGPTSMAPRSLLGQIWLRFIRTLYVFYFFGRLTVRVTETKSCCIAACEIDDEETSATAVRVIYATPKTPPRPPRPPSDADGDNGDDDSIVSAVERLDKVQQWKEALEDAERSIVADPQDTYVKRMSSRLYVDIYIYYISIEHCRLPHWG